MMQNSQSTRVSDGLSNVIKINEGPLKNHLGEMVRSTVEETLNTMLDAEADRLCQAQKFERTESRANSRAGHYRSAVGYTRQCRNGQ